MMYSGWIGGVGFVPGGGVGLVGDRTIAMVVDDPRSELVKQLWEGVLHDTALDDLADQLTRSGLRSLPAFCIAQLDGDGCRLIVRGDLVVTVRRPSTPVDVILDGSTVTTWVEHVEPQLDRIEIHLRDDLSETGVFRVDRGVVPASRLLWGAAAVADQPEVPSSLPPDSARSGLFDPGELPSTATVDPAEVDAPAGPGAVEDIESAAVGEGPAESERDDEIRSVESPELSDVPVQPDPPLDEPADHLSESSAPNATIQFSAGEPGEPVDWSGVENDDEDGVLDEASASDLEPAPVPSADPDVEPLPDAAELPEPAEQAQPIEEIEPAEASGSQEGHEQEQDDADEYDHLFGATQFRPIEAAALIEPDDDDDESSSVSSAGASDGLIQAIPGTGSGQDAGEVPSEVADLGDHDGHTISLAQLRAAMDQEASPVARPSPVDASTMAVMVHAVECTAGHYNPPNAPMCRVCGAEIPTQAHVSVPRPVLGSFRFSTGEDRPVMRAMLLGRSPKADAPVSGELPELVSLDSPRKELSGTHLEVRLEGWQVLVVDRQSTNGTTVQLPGREPVRLHPGEPFQIVPGSVVDMADEVTFTYEAEA